MAKTLNVFTRVDSKIKEQAEIILSQLGLSMATAMEMYLRQIALQRKIPFELALPNNKPTACGSLSDDEFNLLMDQAMKQYGEGKCTPVEDFELEMS